MGISRRPHLRAHNRIEHPHRDLKPRTVGVIQPPTSVRAATTSNLADDGHFLAEERVPPITNPTNSRPVLSVTGTCTTRTGVTPLSDTVHPSTSKTAIPKLLDPLNTHCPPNRGNSNYIKSQPHEPAKNSPADLLAHPERALTAFGIGLTLVDSMAEHASLFLDALDEPVRLLAACSCARVVFELSARVLWLLDPELEPAERQARIYAHRHSGIVQNVKYRRSENRPVHQHEKRIEELAEEATHLGVQVVRRTNGRVAAIGKMPTATELVSTLKGEPLYRMLSAAVHGHHWAIHQLSYRSGGRGNVGNTPVTHFYKEVSGDRLAHLVGIVALGFAPAPAALTDYMGWDGDQWRSIWKRLYSDVRVEQRVTLANRGQGND